MTELEKYLTEYMVKKYTLKTKLQKIEELNASKDGVKAIQYDKEKTAKTNKTTDPMEQVDRYIDAVAEYVKEIENVEKQEKHIEKQILKMQNEEEKQILIDYYLQNKTISEISKKQHKTRQKTLDLLQLAIKNLEKNITF
jgi:Mg2+ and Co2+ transporter CorA